MKFVRFFSSLLLPLVMGACVSPELSSDLGLVAVSSQSPEVRMAAVDAYLRKYNTLPPNCEYVENDDFVCSGNISVIVTDEGNNEVQDIPENWVPFVYDGRVYYFQPLGGK